MRSSSSSVVIAAAAAVIAASVSRVAAGASSIKHVPEGPIKKVVLLCMENRSFDNVLGWWAKVRKASGLNDADGVPDGASNTCHVCKPKQEIFAQPDSEYIQPHDPDHAVIDVSQQIFGLGASTINPQRPATMSGFVDVNSIAWNATDAATLHEAMDGFAAEKLPVISYLADNYAVFDRWFAGVPGPTFPNRLFLYSATSNGEYVNGASNILKGYPQKSIFRNLQDAGVSWKNYFGLVPTSIVFKDTRDFFTNFVWSPKFHTMDTFYKDAAKGNLPSFSYIDPILFSLPGVDANDMHPPHDVARGEKLIHDIYAALRNSPDWEQLLFIITFDEHGGFWDHVSPPDQGVPSPDAASDNSNVFHFNRLGVRVPTIMISPWIPKGTVVHEPTGPQRQQPTSQFEHSSVSATLSKMFKLPFLTRRDAWAGTFDNIASLNSPRDDCPTHELPEPPTISLSDHITDIENEFTEILTVFTALAQGKTP